MRVKGCVDIEGILAFINGSLSDLETTRIKQHISNCKKCRAELGFVRDMQNLHSEVGQEKSERSQREPEEHIPVKLLERYFLRDVTAEETDEVHSHLVHCRKCSRSFDAISNQVFARMSPEEEEIVSRIESVEIQDRLQPYRERLTVRDKSGEKRSERVLDDWKGRLRIPALVGAAALVLMCALWLYDQYRETVYVDRVLTSFKKFVEENPVHREDALRPTGGFDFDFIVRRSSKPQESESPQDAKITAFEEALERKPNDIELNHYLGTLYFFDGEIKKAEFYYKKALELNERNANIYNDLALIDMHRNDLEAAISHLERALQLNPKHQEAQYNLAVVFGLKGEKEKAISAWQTYLKLDTDSSSHWNRLAQDQIRELRTAR